MNKPFAFKGFFYIFNLTESTDIQVELVGVLVCGQAAILLKKQ